VENIWFSITRKSGKRAGEIFRYIFQNFIPENQFEVDHRPHFEILDDYNPNDDSAEEEIWIPIR
jgi:AraC family transcriptional regulator